MEIKDYLHLYIGCECVNEIWPNHRFILNAARLGIGSDAMSVELETIVTEDTGYREQAWYNLTKHNFIKPILRPLSDMTEEEGIEIGFLQNQNFDHWLSLWIKYGTVHTPKSFKHLLSKHFDLFGLIDAGLAIDRTKLNSDKNDAVSDTTEDDSSNN